MTIEIRVLGPGEEMILQTVAPDVFDNSIDPHFAAEFIHDDHHHLAVGLNGDVVVGFASGVTYGHPDKPLELWINEVNVASNQRNQGIGKQVVRALPDVCCTMGCREAWVLSDQSNAAAKRLYESIGGTEGPGETIMYSFVLQR